MEDDMSEARVQGQHEAPGLHGSASHGTVV